MTAAALILTEQNLAYIKKRLRDDLQQVRSSHLTEALARALGHWTHASLIAHLNVADPRDPEIAPIDVDAFFSRLDEFGFKASDDDRLIFEAVTSGHGDLVIQTEAKDSKKHRYVGKRQNAWRNMMVAAINAGIEQKLFSVRAGDNRWPKSANQYEQKEFVYNFTFDGDLPAIASVRDIGWDELAIHVGVRPTARGAELVLAFNAGFHAADAFASGWLERRNTAYLMTSKSQFRCRRDLLPRIAAARVEPKCFGDRGRMII